MTEGQIECRAFVVDETPYCIWDVDIVERNAEYIKSIDTAYFSHVAILHMGLINGPQRQYAALALRAGYYHSLETLFALLCATVQDPHCIIGWMLEYQNRELSAVVRKIDNRQAILSKLDWNGCTWEEIAIRINKFKTGDKEMDSRLRQSFGHLWKHFAQDFLDKDISNEYNSIKHGLRVSTGGFNLAMGLETTPGVLAPPEAMRSLGGSEFGSTFPVVRKLQNKENFQAVHQSLNWRPENLAHGLSLVSMSIQNIVSYLMQVNGIDEKVRYQRPHNEADFDAPWRQLSPVDSLSFSYEIDESFINAMSKAEIMSSLEAKNTEATF